MMNIMIISSCVPDNMWGKAIRFACDVLNKVPHKKLDKIPYEIWKGHSPNLKDIKFWVYLAQVGIPNHKGLR